MPGRRLAQSLEKRRVCRQAAGGTHHRLDQNGGQSVAVTLDQGARGLGIVVASKHHGKGRVDRAGAVREVEHAAVVGAVEHHDQLAAGGGPGRAEGHQIGFGSGVAEADQLARRKATGDERCQLRLIAARRAENDAAVERLTDRPLDHRVGMTVETGAVLAQEVPITVAIEVPQEAILAPDNGQREGRIEDHRAGVAAGQRMTRGLVLGRAFGVGVAVALLGLG